MQLYRGGFQLDSALFFLSGSAIGATDNADFGTDGTMALQGGAFQVGAGGVIQNAAFPNGNNIVIDSGTGGMALTAANGLSLGGGTVLVDNGGDLSANNSINVNANAYMIAGNYASFADAVDICDDGSARMAYGAFTCDASGNVTCLSLTQTSDVNTKTNITPFDTATVLAKIMATPVYHWVFKDTVRTNFKPKITFGTNFVMVTNSVGHGTNRTRVVKQRPVRFAVATNQIAVVHTNLVSNVPHIGPMAQDWSAQFGGKTNAISIIDMQGILLAGEQALADPGRIQVTPFVKLTPFTIPHSTSSTFGYGAGLVAVDSNSLYVSVGTNAWQRVRMNTNGW